LYVQPYPGPGLRVTITSEGNPAEPAWSKNTNELFYRMGQTLMSVKFKTSATEFIPDKPTMLFAQPTLGAGTTVRATYDVGPNGTFLLNQAIPDLTGDRNRKIYPQSLRVILNWTGELRRMLAEH
jgi:hypothetical protein